MNSPQSNQSFELPSRKRLIISTGIAILVSTFILVTVILPAEYDIDPTGLGGILGLTALSGGRATVSPEIADDIMDPAGTTPATVPGTLPVPEPDAAETMPDEYRKLPTPPGTDLSHQTVYRTEVLEIPLALDEELEYKASLAQGEPLLYSWETDEGMVYYDFHGEPAESDERVFMSYEEGEKNTTHGYLIAPFTGDHGWYWLNISDHPVTVKLTVSGYYTWIGKIGEQPQ